MGQSDFVASTANWLLNCCRFTTFQSALKEWTERQDWQNWQNWQNALALTLPFGTAGIHPETKIQIHLVRMAIALMEERSND